MVNANNLDLTNFVYKDVSSFCQVCGYEVLKSPVKMTDWDFAVICSCCKTHYGNDDFLYMILEAEARFGTTILNSLSHSDYVFLRVNAWNRLRIEWLENGGNFWISERKPANWDVKKQLKNIDIEI